MKSRIDFPDRNHYRGRMDTAILRREIERLPADGLDEISAFLVSLRMKRDGRLDELRKRLDDSSEGSWIPWKEVKASLAQADSENCS